MVKKKSCHQKSLEYLALKPSLFGFKNIIATVIEPTLFDNRGRIIAKPDLIFYDANREIYVVEYKSNGDERLIKRAQEQLYNAIHWFSKYTTISPKIKIIDGSQYKELKRFR